VAGVLGLAAAIEYLDKLSMSRIHAHLVKLSQRLYEGLSEVPGLRILGRKGVHDLPLYACVHERHHAYDVATLLDLKGVAVRDGHHCAMPLHQCFGSASSFRVSAWVYNTMDEINLFLDYLSIIIRKLGG
jgi:cysteine desulfurase/selenocysteine lyase